MLRKKATLTAFVAVLYFALSGTRAEGRNASSLEFRRNGPGVSSTVAKFVAGNFQGSDVFQSFLNASAIRRALLRNENNLYDETMRKHNEQLEAHRRMHKERFHWFEDFRTNAEEERRRHRENAIKMVEERMKLEKRQRAQELRELQRQINATNILIERMKKREEADGCSGFWSIFKAECSGGEQWGIPRRIASTPTETSSSLEESTGNLPPITDWESYKTFYGKVYANSSSERRHEQNFEQSLQLIQTHNVMHEAGNVTYALGLNEFSDIDPQTFASRRNGYVKTQDSNETARLGDVFLGPQRGLKASSLDWRWRGNVSPVKDQGDCGACWAFSAVGALESQLLIHFRGTKTLSEQQLVDCDTSNDPDYPNAGCQGGDPETAFKYIRKTGIQSDGDYPYNGKDNNFCDFVKSKVVLSVKTIRKVAGNAAAIKSTLENLGPLSASIHASEPKFQAYKNGVYKCSTDTVDHVVLIVGFGSENGEDYWIVKNSWGTTWGDNGYVKISTSPGSDCGITQDVVGATI